jgi:hypothetical protein
LETEVKHSHAVGKYFASSRGCYSSGVFVRGDACDLQISASIVLSLDGDVDEAGHHFMRAVLGDVLVEA